MMCNCRACCDHRRWIAAIDPQTDEAKAAFNEIMQSLDQAEMDAMFWRMKHQGTWPDVLDA